MEKGDDAEILRRCRAGDERAYRELVDRYRRPVYSMALRMLRREEDAEDFAQETLLTYSPKEESTIYQRVLLPAGVMPVVQQVQITEAMIELVKAGLGVAVLARWAVDPYVKAGALRAVRLTRLGYRRTWSAAVLKDMMRVPHVKAFIDLIVAHPPFTARSRGTVAAGGTIVGAGRIVRRA